jgi:DNA polymerase-1
MIMSYIWQPSYNHSLSFWGDILGCPKLPKPWEGDYPTDCSNELLEYNKIDSLVTLKLFYHLMELLKSDKAAWGLYLNVELPYSLIIQEMESTGLYYDIESAQIIRSETTSRIADILNNCRGLVNRVPGRVTKYKNAKKSLSDDIKYIEERVDGGETYYYYQKYEDFNPNSTEHITYAMSKLYGWKPESFTPTGKAKCDESVLEGCDNEIAKLSLEYKKLDKIVSTFIEPLAEFSDKNGVIRSSFNQCVTVTGRLSSSKPNIQQIPRKGDLGHRMRSLFTCPNGVLMIGGDLSNIEARVLAYYLYEMFGDEQLAKIFISKEDFHSSNAAAWGVDRDAAKVVLFGSIYGIGLNSLSVQLGRSLKDTKKIVDQINSKLPSLKELITTVIDSAKSNDCVLHTLGGRRVYYPALKYRERELRSEAERQVFNALIQGTSADILKILTLQSLEVIHKYDALIAAAVHDELIVFCDQNEANDLAIELTKLWSSSTLLSPVPITAEFKVGKSWSDTH